MATKLNTWSRVSVLAAILAALQVAPTAAQMAQGQAFSQHEPRPALAPTAGPAAATPAARLRPLPAGPSDLTFEGEYVARDWPVFFTQAELARPVTLRLTLENAVSVLPRRSQITVSVNGRDIATAPLDSPGRSKAISVAVPPGLLSPGLNAVRIVVNQRHRVDCGIDATYELWTRISGAESGFVVPGASGSAIRRIADLPALPVDSDGATRIRLRLGEGSDPDTVKGGIDLVQAVVRGAGLVRPLVDLSSEEGSGPGLDIAFADGPGAAGELPGLELDRRAGERVVLLVKGRGTSDLRAQAAQLEAYLRRALEKGSQEGLRSLANVNGASVPRGGRLSLADLGQSDVAFDGRLFRQSLRLRLPGNFLVGDYGAAYFTLDASTAGGLLPGSEVSIRVNSSPSISLPLPEGGGENRRQPVRLPLRLFHPGANDVLIEARLQSQADTQCDTLVSRGARLVLKASSDIAFDTLAELPTVPEIAGPLAGGFPFGAGGHRPSVYVAEGSSPWLGAAATLVANMARQAKAPLDFNLRIGSPAAGEGAGIIIADIGALPHQAQRQLQTRFVRADAPAAGLGAPGEGTALAPPQAPGAQTAKQGWMTDLRARATGLVRTMVSLPFGAEREPQRPIAWSAGDLLATQLRGDSSGDLGGPWMIVTGDDAGSVLTGLDGLVRSSSFDRLHGEAAAFTPESGAMTVVSPDHRRFVITQSPSLSQARYVAAAMFSNSPFSYVALILAACFLLGLSTHIIVRRLGVRT
ncbi:MAG: cellulose biosynthesis cyclic di-GMP-binding regulatory protein BcsB [Alsobacter sp.]